MAVAATAQRQNAGYRGLRGWLEQVEFALHSTADGNVLEQEQEAATELAKSWFGPPDAAPPDELLLNLRRLFPAAEVILTDANPEASLPSIISVASKGIPTCRVGH